MIPWLGYVTLVRLCYVPCSISLSSLRRNVEHEWEIQRSNVPCFNVRVCIDRQSKAQATYCSPKSSKSQTGGASNKQNATQPPKNAAYNARSSSLSKQPPPSPLFLPSSGRCCRASQATRPHKRPRVKLETSETSNKHEALQRLQPSSKAAKADPFVIPTSKLLTYSRRLRKKQLIGPRAKLSSTVYSNGGLDRFLSR